MPLAGVFYGLTGSWIGAAGVTIFGIFIDVDHLLDFWHDRGLNFDVRKFFEYATGEFQSKYYIILHSFELLIIFWLAIKASFFSYFFCGAAAGLILHLFLDYIAMQYKGCGKWYSFLLLSFIFRLFFGFRQPEIDRLCKKERRAG